MRVPRSSKVATTWMMAPKRAGLPPPGGGYCKSTPSSWVRQGPCGEQPPRCLEEPSHVRLCCNHILLCRKRMTKSLVDLHQESSDGRGASTASAPGSSSQHQRCWGRRESMPPSPGSNNEGESQLRGFLIFYYRSADTAGCKYHANFTVMDARF